MGRSVYSQRIYSHHYETPLSRAYPKPTHLPLLTLTPLAPDLVDPWPLPRAVFIADDHMRRPSIFERSEAQWMRDRL